VDSPRIPDPASYLFKRRRRTIWTVLRETLEKNLVMSLSKIEDSTGSDCHKPVRDHVDR